jgi:radical SAM protein with 4Fe4S-binding SPASM domain
MCAGEEILSPGNVRGRSFIDFWRDDWQIRHYSWKNFKETCEGCIVNDPRYYCSSRCPATSHARNGVLFGCGSSSFEKLSLITRTAMLEATALGKTTGVPVAEKPAPQSELATPERERTIIPLQFVG